MIRRGQAWSLVTDLAPAGFALVAGIGSGLGPGSAGSWWVAFGPILVAALVLLVRRRHPLPVLGVVLADTLALHAAYGGFWLGVPVAIALYTVGAHCRRREALLAASLTAVVLAPVIFGTTEDPLLAVPKYALFAAAFILGDNLRTRRAYLRELEDRAARLEREREENARRAVAEEQARIARELHDVIAHNVSVMVVQAAAGRDVFDSHPDRAREALASVERTGREALTELRRLLGGVRGRPQHADYAPQPGLARIGGLLEEVRAAGLAVDLAVEGEPRDLPPGVDLSAYRIVQEALTNTLRHADAHAAAVRLAYAPDGLEVAVVDDGRGAPASGNGNGNGSGGHGLVGMRERVALFGGELETGPREGGGFRVRARFPV